MTNLEILFRIAMVGFVCWITGVLVFISLIIYSILVGSSIDPEDNGLLRTKKQKDKYREKKLRRLEKFSKERGKDKMVTVAVRLTSTSCDHYLHLVEVNDVLEFCNKLDELNYEFEQGYIDDWEIAFNDDIEKYDGKRMKVWSEFISSNLKNKKEIRDKEWRELNG